jgi:hypothetical protein
MQIAETRSYDARLAERSLVRGRDGRSAFKLYRLDIVGRENPERYEWKPSGLDPAELRRQLESQEGVGFVTAFPHITKVFRFDPGAETVLIVQAFRTAGFEILDLGRPEGLPGGSVEFACLAEALIAADEYRLWARSPDVARYLASWSRFRAGAIRDHGKLRRHWMQGA